MLHSSSWPSTPFAVPPQLMFTTRTPFFLKNSTNAIAFFAFFSASSRVGQGSGSSL